MHASQNGNKEIVELFVRADADIYLRNREGYDALTLASSMQRQLRKEQSDNLNPKDYENIIDMLKAVGAN